MLPIRIIMYHPCPRFARKVKGDLSPQHVYIEDGTHETREAAFKHYHFTMFCGDFSLSPFPPLALVYSLAYVAHVPQQGFWWRKISGETRICHGHLWCYICVCYVMLQIWCKSIILHVRYLDKFRGQVAVNWLKWQWASPPKTERKIQCLCLCLCLCLDHFWGDGAWISPLEIEPNVFPPARCGTRRALDHFHQPGSAMDLWMVVDGGDWYRRESLVAIGFGHPMTFLKSPQQMIEFLISRHSWFCEIHDNFNHCSPVDRTRHTCRTWWLHPRKRRSWSSRKHSPSCHRRVSLKTLQPPVTCPWCH